MLNIRPFTYFSRTRQGYNLTDKNSASLGTNLAERVNLCSYRNIKEECHEVNINFMLSTQQCDELTKLGCYNSQDVVRDLCNICTSLANKLIIQATAVSHLYKEANIRLAQDIDSYVASRINAVLDDVRNEKQKNIPSKVRAELVRTAMVKGGYEKIVEGKSDEKLLSFARPGLTAEVNTLADQMLPLNARVVNYLNKAIKPSICDQTYDAIVSHPEINQRHLQQERYMAVLDILNIARQQAEDWLEEGRE
ncbi:peptide transporter [Salmonella enterica subsp. arizonae]|nr:peptide transporter [Salmonella enterica]EAW2114769.1 peptide transporter [Salmonella enterica subsp. enterica]ECJ2545336.1 peptide transporter [Salmonella enterica subsp. arizonae]EDW2495507.1 peptide transporter [Salmonella enterica subsp. enterica serovar Oranienburg]EKY1893350.1 peptide transporter [Salmonella enterica subsp. arizonae serovar 35:z4,z32:-]